MLPAEAGLVSVSDVLSCSTLMSRASVISSSMVLILSGSSTESSSVLVGSLRPRPLLVEAARQARDSSSEELARGTAVLFLLPLVCLWGRTFSAGGSWVLLVFWTALCVDFFCVFCFVVCVVASVSLSSLNST